MANKLKKLTKMIIQELSIVRVPANQFSETVLLKSHESDSGNVATESRQEDLPKMNFDELLVKMREAVTSTVKEAVAPIQEDLTKMKESKKSSTTDDEGMEEDKNCMKKSADEDMIKSMQAELEELKKSNAEKEEALRKANEATEFEALKKSAEETYPNVPGTAEEKATLLKSVEGDTRTYVESLMKSLNESMTETLTELGHDSMAKSAKQGTDKVEAMIKQYCGEHKLDYNNALHYAEAFNALSKNGEDMAKAYTEGVK